MSGVPFQTSYQRALRLRCPRCGVGVLFRSLVRMNSQCEGCGLTYEREPGYFLGSTYVNYGWTCLSLTCAYMLLHFGLGYSNAILTVPLTSYAILFPLFFHRYARALWLALDTFFDHTDLPDHEHAAPASAGSSGAAPPSSEGASSCGSDTGSSTPL